MSTGKNKRAVIVGLFVTVGLLIFLVGIFTLGGQKKSFVPSIKVQAVFDNVNGLQKGDNVWFSGVKVGTVKAVDFDGSSRIRVTMQIEKKAQEFIRKDAKAKVGAEGFIGNKLIVIYGGSTKAEAIEGGEHLQVENTLSTDDMMATLQKNNENLVAITTNFKTVSNRLANGEGTAGALLNDATLYKSLASTASNLQQAAHNSELLSSRIAAYTAQLDKPGSLANGLVHDTMIMANLQAAVQQINNAADAAHSFTANLKTVSDQLHTNDNTLGMLLNDQQTAEQMKIIIQNLSVGSEKLDDDLEAIQHNFLFRGYFKKKAKQEEKARKEAEKNKQ
ncbi:ABC transporter permease [Niastella yeongjuensis]|uniref:ABC transporter permease n=1 Tax=Niastella yeongjuensis TaxID=354355 RepID=A0A1V9EW27_9BACT|nr:MlaD family protein [Niastella yeongjuensis]OQP50346.1 ABC transporter permease [Niastella yeongjuensis]SEN38419.1 phospholipid/cholesterol/gamma-HCH transport system substrate-binding protein [Niastella yeongjuensis]